MATKNRVFTIIKGHDTFMKQEGVVYKCARWLSDGQIAIYYNDKKRLRSDGQPALIMVVFALERVRIEK